MTQVLVFIDQKDGKARFSQSVNQMNIRDQMMIILKSEGPKFLSQLAYILGCTSATIGIHAEKLERWGFIESFYNGNPHGGGAVRYLLIKQKGNKLK